jgi:6-phosphogluconolactonase
MQGIPDPTYLAGPANDVLYALGKTPEGGAVYALRQKSGADCTDGADSGSGLGAESDSRIALTIMNSLLSAGQGPCHISLDPRGEYLLCAIYGSGSVALFTLGSDGSINALSDFRQYSGVGYDSSDRQKGPHAHFATFHSERNEVLVCDLGLDMVCVYELDRAGGKLLDTDRSIRLPDGAGPRHLAFHSSHPGMLFVIAEMANTIFAYRFDEASRQCLLVQSISAVPSGPDSDEITPSDRELMLPPTADNGSIGCAIRFSSDGEYLFVSSRLGYQSISAFRCGHDGQLRFCSRCLCGGITPRDFNVFEGNGVDYILSANQDSDLITALRFDRGTENLTLLNMKMQANKPTCILPL